MAKPRTNAPIIGGDARSLMKRLRRHWKTSLASTVLLIVVAVIAVPWIYIHLLEGNQAAALSLNSIPTAASTTSGAGSATTSVTTGATSTTTNSVNGTWIVTSGSLAGYRVMETLAGQNTTAVGRTSAVKGSLTVSGTKVTAATFTVQMSEVTSDQSQRDQQFSGRIMDTQQYPTGTFVLTKSIELGTIPAVGVTTKATASGNLTLHGTTKPVTFTMSAKRTGSTIAVTGDITIAYGDYNIANPSFGGFVSVGSSGTIEFLLITARS
jgi:polyisoprenoid-binding protein YceI